ncbi:EI24 domain-containing protein [Helicobacter aurati]|nr:EI24 domain-containing protein [Helicobacter aurati]
MIYFTSNSINSRNFFAFLQTPFAMTFKSLKHPKILALSIVPVFFIACLYVALFITSLYHFNWFLQKFPAMWLNYAVQDGLLNTCVYVVLCLFAFIGITILIVFVVGVISLIITCFFAPIIVQFTQREFYPSTLLNPPSFLESLKLSAVMFSKTLLKFLILSMFCSLLDLIGLGLIGMILSIFFYFRFFCVNLNYEIALNIMSDSEYKIFLQHNAMPITVLNGVLFIPLYLPIINFFVLPWQILVLSHFMLNWYTKFSLSKDEEVIEILQ